MSIDQDDARIGIVIPLFRHSGLVTEAIGSALQQQGRQEHVVALVNDGCPFRETDLVCAAQCVAAGEIRLHVIRRSNGGLSAARNTGIAFLLQNYPKLQAIYFLDADNRLEPYALEHMARALADHPEADWFYPDLEMFGLEHTAQYEGIYSGLIHTGANISEAGSLVRRRVFDAGVRFDEQMRQGYEDWDFWLTALEAGFRGRHLPHLGLSYRKRPESMLADSHRDNDEIRGYIRRKHKPLYQVRNLLEMEAAQHPRYAIFLDDGAVVICLDPREPLEIIDQAEYARRFWRWMLRPSVHDLAPFLVVMRRITFEVLREGKLLEWVLWDLEARLEGAPMTKMQVGRHLTPGLEITSPERSQGATHGDVLMIQVDLARAVCAANDPDWSMCFLTGGADLPVSSRALLLDHPRADRLGRGATEARLFQVVADLYHSLFRPPSSTVWNLGTSGIPPRHLAYRSVRAAVNGSPVLPRKDDGRCHVAFVLPHADFGGVEKVAFNVARELREFGFVPHLVLFRTGEMHVPVAYRDVFESFLWATSRDLLRWDGADYHGTRLSWWSTEGDKSEFVGLLSAFDIVINGQSADAHGLMGELRRRGVLTIAHAHVVEHTRAGRPGGSATIARAFEHSYSAIWAASRQLEAWFVANAVPQDKLILLENAPGYRMSADALDEIRRARLAERGPGRPLRILFAARFDVQKGLDRLLSLVRLSKQAGLAIEWRVLGKSIVEADESVVELGTLVTIEKPAYTDAELTSIYRWADILLLPSRFEGMPLTIVEAMRCGVVVLAAEAGAVSEAIVSGVNGFIVPQATCVPAMWDLLVQFARNPSELRPIAEAAMRFGSTRRWCDTVRNAVLFLQSSLQRRTPIDPSERISTDVA